VVDFEPPPVAPKVFEFLIRLGGKRAFRAMREASVIVHFAIRRHPHTTMSLIGRPNQVKPNHLYAWHRNVAGPFELLNVSSQRIFAKLKPRLEHSIAG